MFTKINRRKDRLDLTNPPWRDSRGCTTITHDRSIHPSITCDPYNFSSVAPMLPSIEHSLDHSNDSKIIFHFFHSFLVQSLASEISSFEISKNFI